MARRRFQRGQLIRSGDNWLGRWREDVEDDTGAVKRVHRKEVIGTVLDFPTKRLAERELARRLEPINNVEYRPQRRITFEAFSQKWLNEVLVHQKRSSQASAASYVRAHLIPAFSATNLADIRMEQIQRFVTGLKRSPKTVKNVVSTMMSMWEQAQAWGYVQHNPFPRGASGRLLLKLPPADPSATYHFTVEEVLAIIDKAEGRWKTFFRTLAETGMRPGELIGLRRDAIGDGSLTIRQSVWRRQVQTPKTKAGIRTFAISASLAAELRRLVVATDDNDLGLVFPEDDGRPLCVDNFRQKVLNPILKELGIRDNFTGRMGNYAFRHMNITELRRMNVPLKTIQKRVGHAVGSDVTDRHYVHAIEADDRMAADRIGALLAASEGARVH